LLEGRKVVILKLKSLNLETFFLSINKENRDRKNSPLGLTLSHAGFSHLKEVMRGAKEACFAYLYTHFIIILKYYSSPFSFISILLMSKSSH